MITPFHTLSCDPVSAVIYHYCVIVEMFCIGLYARHTFRKVEQSVVDVLEMPIIVCQTEKAVQTDEVQLKPHKLCLSSEEVGPAHCNTGMSTPGFNSASEDTLCRIEHAPLDGYRFPQLLSKPEPTKNSSAEGPAISPTHISVRPEINYQASSDVTVV